MPCWLSQTLLNNLYYNLFSTIFANRCHFKSQEYQRQLCNRLSQIWVYGYPLNQLILEIINDSVARLYCFSCCLLVIHCSTNSTQDRKPRNKLEKLSQNLSQGLHKGASKVHPRELAYPLRIAVAMQNRSLIAIPLMNYLQLATKHSAIHNLHIR